LPSIFAHRVVRSLDQAQIHGEIAWARLLNRKIEPFVAVGEEEVKSVIDR
jgi:hypothetical protein